MDELPIKEKRKIQAVAALTTALVILLGASIYFVLSFNKQIEELRAQVGTHQATLTQIVTFLTAAKQ